MVIRDFVLLLEALSDDNYFKIAFSSFLKSIKTEANKLGIKLDRKDFLDKAQQTVGRFKVNPSGFLNYAIKGSKTIDLETLKKSLIEIAEIELKGLHADIVKEAFKDSDPEIKKLSGLKFDTFIEEFTKNFKDFIETDKDIYSEYPEELLESFESKIAKVFSSKISVKQRASGKTYENKVTSYIEKFLKVSIKPEPMGTNRFPDGEIGSGANKTIRNKQYFAEDAVWIEVKEGRQTPRSISSSTIESIYKDSGGTLKFEPKNPKFWTDMANVLNQPKNKKKALVVLGLSYGSVAKALYFISRVDSSKTLIKKVKETLWSKTTNKFYAIGLSLSYGTLGVSGKPADIFSLPSKGGGYSPNYKPGLNAYLSNYSMLKTDKIEEM